MARGYRRFSSADETVWERLAVMQPSPLLVRWDSRLAGCVLSGPVWWDPVSRRRSPGRLTWLSVRRSPWPRRGSVAAGNRGGAGSGTVDDQSGGRRSWRAGSVSARRRPGGVVAGQAPAALQAGHSSGAACDGGREAQNEQWSPEQIAGWLKTTYPDEAEMQVSHETIYRTLFIQSRGALRRELTAHLRTSG